MHDEEWYARARMHLELSSCREADRNKLPVGEDCSPLLANTTSPTHRFTPLPLNDKLNIMCGCGNSLWLVSGAVTGCYGCGRQYSMNRPA